MIVIVMDFNSPKCQNMNNNDKEMKVIMNKTNEAITSMQFCWPTPSAIKLNASKNNNKKKLDRWSNKMKNVEFKVNLGFRKMSHKKELLTMAKTLIMLQTKKKGEYAFKLTENSYSDSFSCILCTQCYVWFFYKYITYVFNTLCHCSGKRKVNCFYIYIRFSLQTQQNFIILLFNKWTSTILCIKYNFQLIQKNLLPISQTIVF